MRSTLIASLVLATSSAALPAAAAHAAQSPGATEWDIGPRIRGRNHSVGMPLTPLPSRRGPYFDIPYPSVEAGHVHYVTFPHGPLTGKSRIVMRYRIDAAPGVRLVARENPRAAPILSLYFQRRGDSWSTRRGHEAYRWYAPLYATGPLTPGEHMVSIRLNDNWGAVMTSTARTNPRAFQEALADTERVGFVLGADGGRGHGVYATGPARFTILSFQVL